MQAATRHFKKEGYTVDDVSAQRPYDLLCRKDTKNLYVEVKAGTTTDGDTVVLTRNEVRHAGDPNHLCALFILHSMRLEHGKTLDGQSVVVNPWHLQKERLTPICYTIGFADLLQLLTRAVAVRILMFGSFKLHPGQ